MGWGRGAGIKRRQRGIRIGSATTSHVRGGVVVEDVVVVVVDTGSSGMRQKAGRQRGQEWEPTDFSDAHTS